VVLRGKVTERHATFDRVPGSRFTHPKVCGRVFGAVLSEPNLAPKPDGSKRGRGESDVGRSLGSTPRAFPKEGVHANSSRRASPHLEPKRERWCVLEAVHPTEAGLAATKPPFGFSRPKL
jgi:hypothetical protein